MNTPLAEHHTPIISILDSFLPEAVRLDSKAPVKERVLIGLALFIFCALTIADLVIWLSPYVSERYTTISLYVITPVAFGNLLIAFIYKKTNSFLFLSNLMALIAFIAVNIGVAIPRTVVIALDKFAPHGGGRFFIAINGFVDKRQWFSCIGEIAALKVILRAF